MADNGDVGQVNERRCGQHSCPGSWVLNSSPCEIQGRLTELQPTGRRAAYIELTYEATNVTNHDPVTWLRTSHQN